MHIKSIGKGKCIAMLVYILYVYIFYSNIELRKTCCEWLSQDRHFVKKENNFLMEE